MRFVTFVAILAAALLAGPCSADEPADTRVYWVCEGGWFAKARDGSWYELNELTYRKLGKPSRFREVKRTKEYVELYDEGRKVAVRLSDSGSEVRNSNREDAVWEKLYSGRWKTPSPEE
jgi:hypothetical protein